MRAHPRLSRGVTITRRQIGEQEIYYLVKEPRSGAFLRMGEVEAAVLRLLEGTRSLPEVAEALIQAHDVHVGVPVIEQFVGTLTRRGLVESPTFDPAAFREEWQQQQRARRRSLGRLMGSLVNLKLKLFNPQRLFAHLVGPLDFVWTRGFVVWTLALMAIAGLLALAHRDEIARSIASFYHSATSSAGSFASHAAIIYVVFFLVVAVHETAHGLTCTHFGGRVTDMGFILFYLQIPGFYCDITDAYGFERRGDRLWTTVAGGYTGLVLASLGVFLWWMTEPGDLLNGAGIVLMFVGGPPLLIFNWNPLIRYDGYYILMDLLEAPNLLGNSQKYLAHVFKARVLRVPVEPMEVTPRLRKIYLIYGIASLMFLGPLIASMPMIIYYIFSRLFGQPIAVVLAVIFGYRILKAPAVKAFTTLRYAWLTHRRFLMGSTAAQSGGARKALLGTGAALALVLVLVGPRFAVRVQAIGVLEPWERIEVRAAVAGFVTVPASRTMPREGDRVQAGDLLVRLENRDLEAESRAARRELEALRLQLTSLRARGDPASAAVRRAAQRSLQRRGQVLAERIAHLALRAPIAGVVLTPRLDEKVGTYLEPGEIWCVIGRSDRLRVRVTLTERDLGAIGERYRAEIKALHLPGTRFRGRVSRLPAGQRAPVPPAQVEATVAGPASPADPASADARAVSGTLQVEVKVDNASGQLRPGMTARVRIYGRRLPAAGHALRWARRLFRGKVWW